MVGGAGGACEQARLQVSKAKQTAKAKAIDAIQCSAVASRQQSADTRCNCMHYSNRSGRFYYDSSAHLFSARTASSSSGVKSFVMLKVLRICSGVLPLIIEATFAHVRSSKGLISI